MQTTSKSKKTSGQLDPKFNSNVAKNSNAAKTEYKIDTTMYQVRSVFRQEEKTESLESKIKRLILGDNNCKQLAI